MHGNRILQAALMQGTPMTGKMPCLLWPHSYLCTLGPCTLKTNYCRHVFFSMYAGPSNVSLIRRLPIVKRKSHLHTFFSETRRQWLVAHSHREFMEGLRWNASLTMCASLTKLCPVKYSPPHPHSLNLLARCGPFT